jgi:biopolymer transport protein TolQ
MGDVTVIQEQGLFAMMFGSGPVVQMVLILLLLLSVWSWAISIGKYLQFRKARAQSQEFRNLFWEVRNLARIGDSSKRLAASPLVRLFAAGYGELTQMLQSSEREVLQSDADVNLESIERSMRHAQMEQTHELEGGITFLATVASAAPFIGLFGTVWGIMNAFHGLSSLKSTTLQAVAPGISEALIATAIGLAAAIPAAVAYNFFAVALRRFKEQMDGFTAEFLTVARRCFLRPETLSFPQARRAAERG